MLTKIRTVFLETIALQSPRGRIIFAVLAITFIYLSPYHWFENLSLYKRAGLTWVPSIGLTRAFWHLTHGNLVAAWERNWLIFPILFVGLSIILLDIYKLLRKTF
jgi:hypothetical protein